MRTLKKTLCLVLCLAMMVGLCAVGASAAFDDADKIQNTEAVDLLTGLGVITGMGDGTFNPTGTLTRAQAAAIITRLLGLGELAKATTVFSDVPADYWASGYIALCNSQGIIAGLGDGTFNPEGKLKGYEWAKMLLCALGYDAKQEGLVGTDFEINVERLVKKTLLADGIKFIGSAEINRDNACRLGFNALTVPMVEYNGGTQVSTSDGTQVTVNANITPAGSYLADNFKLDVMPAAGGTWQSKDVFDDGTLGTAAYVEGVIIENSANNDVKTTTLQDGTVYVIDTDASLLGHYVKIYREKTPNADGSIPALSIVDESKVVTVSTAIAAGDAAAFKKAFGVAAAQVTVRGTASDAIFPANPGAVADGNTNCDPTLVAATPVGTYILDPTNTVVAEINPAYSVVTLNKVSAIVTKADNETISFNAGALTINNGKKVAGVAQDFIREYDGIAKDDYVLLTKMGAIYTAAKCETVEGKISAVATNNAITLDGTVYKASAAADASGLTAVAPGTITAANMKANTYTLYLDGNGKYITCVIKTGEAAVSDLMYVVATYNKTESTTYGNKTMTYAQVLDMNGKEDKVLIGVDATTANYVNGEGRNALAAGFYTFAANGADAAGKALGIKAAAALAQNAVIAQPGDLSWSVLAANTNLKTTTANVALATAGKAYLTADTVYLFVTGTKDTLKVEKKTGGVNMDGLTAGNAKFVFTEDADANQITKAVIITTAFEDAGVDSSTMIYTPANAAKKATTNTGFTYNVYNAATGEATTITADDDGGITAGFHKFSVVNGVYKVTAAAEAEGSSIKLNEVYASKYGTKITSNDIADYDVSGAIIVDTRDPDDWGDEGELNTLAAIDAASKLPGVVTGVTFDAIVNAAKGTVSIIFVKAYA